MARRWLKFTKRHWAPGDVFWAVLFIGFGLLLIFAVYVLIHLWKDSTLRQFLF